MKDYFLSEKREHKGGRDMSERSSISRCASKVAVIAVTAFMIIAALPCAAFATSARTEVPGKVYESDKDGHYEFSDKAESAETSSENTYGSFLISGEVSNVTEKSGVPAYEVSEGNLQLFYNYGDTLASVDKGIHNKTTKYGLPTY
jgi:hypothetical protein